MANFENFGIGVEAKVRADSIQQQLDKIAATKKPVIKVLVEVDQTSIAKAVKAVRTATTKKTPNELVQTATGNVFGLTEKDYKQYVQNFDSSMAKMTKSAKTFAKTYQESFNPKSTGRYTDQDLITLQKVQTATGNSFGLTEKDYQQYVQNFDTGMSKMTKSSKDFAKTYQDSFHPQATKRYTKQDLLTAGEVNNIDKAKSAMSGLNTEGTKGSNIFGKFGQTLMQNVGKFAQWLIAGNLIMQFLRQIQTAVQYVKDIDKAMTNLQIITGMSETSARGLITAYNQLGKEIGATTMEVASGAEEWFRAGKTAEEALYLTRQSLTLSKLAGMSAADATQALISSLNGYKLAATEATGVIDKLIAVDNAAATSAQELASAMSLTAATAKMAGVPMDKLIGLIGTVSSVTRRSAETIGAAFKTIFSRMGNVKVGKFIDNEDGSAINDVEGLLNKLVIKLRDSKDTFRDFGDVLDEIGGRWDSFTEVEKNALGTSIAGKQRRMLELIAI